MFISMVVVVSCNYRNIQKGYIVSPWRKPREWVIIPSFTRWKQDMEYSLGFFPIRVPYLKKCKNACGKQTFHEICVHCSYYKQIYNKEPPAKQNIILTLLMINKRSWKLPNHFVKYFIKKYI